MRFRNLLILVLLVLVEIAIIGIVKLGLFGFLETSVQIATILALLLPVYALWRQNLEKKRDLVDGVRIWAAHFDLMTRQFVEPGAPAPGQLTLDDVGKVRALADTTADHLAEAIARGYRLFKDSTPITSLISALRVFARNMEFSRNHGLFIQEIQNLRPKTQAVSDIANKEIAKHNTRFGLPEKSFTVLTSRLAERIVVSALVVFTVLWGIVVLSRFLRP